MKFNGVNSVNFITLDGAENRQRSMNLQLDKYSVKNRKMHVNGRFSHIKNYIKWQCAYPQSICDTGLGVGVSHLNSIRMWYENTNEPYAVFMEDDIDFTTADYWNFTFQDVIDRMPSDWEALQLIRIKNFSLGYDGSEGINFRHREWNDWGCGAFCLTRGYAKKLLSRNMRDDEYVMTVGGLQPIVENIVYVGLGVVYNLPLFVEKLFDSGDIDTWDAERGVKDDHRKSAEHYKNLWKNNTLTLDKIMGITHD